MSLATRFYPITHALRWPLPIHGYHLGQLLLLLFYFAVLLFGALFRDSVFKHSVREGTLVASQLPWMYILATKNNAIGTLVGRGYEKLNYLHRYVGRLVVLAANVHALGFIYRWVQAGVWTQRTQEMYIRWGLVALVSMDILFFFSLAFIRQNYYNVFYVSHSISLVVLLVAACLHQPFTIPYVAIAAGFYGADHVLRLVKSRAPKAHLQPIPELGTTLVRVPSLNAGWRAGQFVRLRVLSGRMGWYRWSETHPYTIASACEGSGAEGMTLMVKKTGRWSRQLYDIASASSETESGGLPTVRVLVEGPYGGPGLTNFASFSGALFVVGGSGISFGLATTQELIQRAAQGTTSVKAVQLVWSVHHARSLDPLLPLLTSLLQQSYNIPIDLTIKVFYTRAVSQNDDEHYPPLDKFPPGLSLASGRPRLPEVLTGLIDVTTNALSAAANGDERAAGHGVIVGACGPASLSDDARRAIHVLGKAERECVGGVELHDEAFHW